jgi:N4-(beta-N-acetylglucosaminyl)-L-asparaginase
MARDDSVLDCAPMKPINRRQFVQAGAAVAAAAAAPARAFGQAPTVMTPRSVKPLVVCSANGNQYKNGGSQTCVEKAFALIVSGSDVLDAVIAGVNLNELDPLDMTVGYGALPNAEGVLQLDSSCMHGPRKRAGGVSALEGVKTASLVARAVADKTDHHLLTGQGAQDFARRLGFEILSDLNTDASRKAWFEWKRKTDPLHYLDPEDRAIEIKKISLAIMREFGVSPEHYYGTINCDGLSPKGDICGVTTTSGLAWKIPGRVGDSPILGAGLYVDNEVGAAGSTGRGEANLFNLTSFLIVEFMRRGMHPKDAGMEALKRIKANTIEKRLLNSRGLPNFGIDFYVMNARGEYAGVGMYPSRFAICTENGAETRPVDALLDGKPED